MANELNALQMIEMYCEWTKCIADQLTVQQINQMLY